MRDLSLHILDIMENSIRAGASLICVTLLQDLDQDLLQVTIEDNGCGIDEPSEKIADPFYTTKPGKKTGLGLSLFKAAAECAEGSFTIGNSTQGGIYIKANFRLSHVDRNPLGDLAASMSSVVCTNPGIAIVCRLCSSENEIVVSTTDASKKLNDSYQGLVVARRISEQIKKGLNELHFVD